MALLGCDPLQSPVGCVGRLPEHSPASVKPRRNQGILVGVIPFCWDGVCNPITTKYCSVLGDGCQSDADTPLPAEDSGYSNVTYVTYQLSEWVEGSDSKPPLFPPIVAQGKYYPTEYSVGFSYHPTIR